MGLMSNISGKANAGIWGALKFGARLDTAAKSVGFGKSVFQNRTALGAIAGGIYGAMSDDTSVLGGAAMGAGLARYGGSAIAGGIGNYRSNAVAGLSRFSRGAYAGGGAARGAYNQMYGDAMRSGLFIGRSAARANRGFNSFRARGGIGGALGRKLYGVGM